MWLDSLHTKCMSNDVEILSYNNGLHRQSLIELWRTAFGYEAPHNEPGLVIDKKLAVADNMLFVAVRGTTVVGSIMAGYDGHRGWLYSVAVHPQHRERGVGSMLVCHAERMLEALGCVKINLQILESNESVKAFYASLGYAVEKRVSMGKLLMKP